MESGLLSLRAELLKKKSQIKKTSTFEVRPEVKPFYKEKRSSKLKKTKTNKGKKTRANKDASFDREDALKHEKSKQTLERKALLYDEIKSGTKVLEDDELNERFLVNFQGKIYNEVSELSTENNLISQNSSSHKNELTESKCDFESIDSKAGTSEEWVEYTDSFGRSRICLREDLEDMQKKDSNEEIKNVHKEKWEMIEEQSINKSNIHYQDVLFDEARSHGTAFMPFSRDEKEREAQQQFLKDIGSQANKVHLTKEALKKKRQKMMELRLAKVREKKRLKMGLPVKDIDDLKMPSSSDEEEEEEQNNMTHVENESKEKIEKSLNLPKNDATSGCKDKPIREWDIGKPGVSSLMSQKQWIETRRKDRENDFAPPPNYETNNFTNQKKKNNDLLFYKSFNPASSDSSDDKREKRPSEFAPPSTFEYYRPVANKRTKFSTFNVDLEAAISKGLSEIRKNTDKLS